MEQKEFCDFLTSYQGMSKMLKTCSYQEILSQTAGLMWKKPEEMEAYSADGYSNGECYRNILKNLLKNAVQYDWLYSRLSDDSSRMIFANLTGYRILPADSFLRQAYNLSREKEIRENDCLIKTGMADNGVSSVLKARQQIRKGVPGLKIRVDDAVSDLWVIPRLIDAIRADYRFFIRHYDRFGNRETILYVMLPEKKRSVCQKNNKRIVALAPYERGWSDAELLKDCGLIPYLFYKNHHCDVSMVGARMEGYLNLKYVEGMKMEFLSDGKRQTKEDYIRKEAKNIDCLVLRGAYEDYLSVVDIYKKCNPHGKVFLPLDANSRYMDRIQWTEPGFVRFMSQCDVIATSGRAIQKHLNVKWPWVIEHIPNGFCFFTDRGWDPSFDKKENIILTVGRLGTSQKATEILLEAFAGIAETIPGWELHLVGSVEASFKGYLEQFRERFSHLRGRIRFLGHIADRNALYKEYLKSKIFALPSSYEGGTPNVIAEALYAGNVIAVTKIDEYEEATDYGRCGMASEINDVPGFQKILSELCQSEYLEEMSHHACEYARKHYDMERIVDKIYYLIFGA